MLGATFASNIKLAPIFGSELRKQREMQLEEIAMVIK